MKILILSEFFPSNLKLDITGGMEARNYFIAKNLAEKHEVYIISGYEKNKPRQQLLNKIHIFRVGFYGSYTRKAIFQRIFFIFFAFIQGLNIDFELVEGAGFWSFLPAYFLGLIKRKKKSILVPDLVDSYAKDTGTIPYFLMRNVEKFILRLNWDQIICISNTIKNKLISLKINQKKIITIYCGVPLKIITGIKVSKRKNSIITISRLVPYKRISDLIFAVSILRSQSLNIQLEIIGNGEELFNLKELSDSLSLNKMIFFHEFIPNYEIVIKYLKSAKIFCLPSTVEGFGIATIEAMAANVPTVIADIPVNHEVTNNKGALFFEPQNPEDLADKLKMLLIDKILYQRLKIETKDVVKKYDWKIIAQKTESAYESLCNN